MKKLNFIVFSLLFFFGEAHKNSSQPNLLKPTVKSIKTPNENSEKHLIKIQVQREFH